MKYSAEDGRLKLVLTGDSAITRNMSVYREPDFLALRDLIQRADVAVTNVEMLFHDYESAPAVTPGGTYMRGDARMITELEWLGFNLFAAANNHGFDYGENGLMTHLRHLEASGVPFAGIGRSMREAREPCYLDTDAGRVALVSVTSSGPQALYAGDQWRDGRGRPGANMIRQTNRYVVDKPTFDSLRRMRDALHLNTKREIFGQNEAPGQSAATDIARFRDNSYGMSDAPDTDTEFYMGDLHNRFQCIVPNGYRFTLGDSFESHMVPVAEDLDENLKVIREARRCADWIVVSMHNHEPGSTMDLPSDVAVEFAHAAIDAGADVFHGHGPHRDRGIEIYKGKPILYSLGHFILESETISRIPRDNMVRQGLDPWEATPTDFFDAQTGTETGDDWLGRADSPSSWRDAIAIIDLGPEGVEKVVLQPIDLGFRRPRHMRGRPLLARGEEAQAVLTLFQRLSEPFGTVIDIAEETGNVRLDTQS